jgi:hypothetical protein
MAIKVPSGVHLERMKANPTTLLVVSVAMLVLGSIFIAITISSMLAAGEAAGWPTTEGIVLDGHIDKQEGSEGEVSYSPELAYRYQVDGVIYYGDRLFVTPYSSDYSWAQSYLYKYPVGSTITVHYDSENPSEAVIELQANQVDYVLLMVGIVFIAFGAAFLVVLVFRRRKKK